MILPKFHLILPKYFFFPPRKSEFPRELFGKFLRGIEMCRSHQNDQRNREAHYIQERTTIWDARSYKPIIRRHFELACNEICGREDYWIVIMSNSVTFVRQGRGGTTAIAFQQDVPPSSLLCATIEGVIER